MNSSNNTTNTTHAAKDDAKQMRIMYGSLAALAVLTNAPLLLVLLKRKSQSVPVFCARMSYLVGNLALADCLSGTYTYISQQYISLLKTMSCAVVALCRGEPIQYGFFGWCTRCFDTPICVCLSLKQETSFGARQSKIVSASGRIR